MSNVKIVGFDRSIHGYYRVVYANYGLGNCNLVKIFPALDNEQLIPTLCDIASGAGELLICMHHHIELNDAQTEYLEKLPALQLHQKPYLFVDLSHLLAEYPNQKSELQLLLTHETADWDCSKNANFLEGFKNRLRIAGQRIPHINETSVVRALLYVIAGRDRLETLAADLPR